MADIDEGAWRDAIAGEGDEAPARLEALKAFETPTELFDAHQTLSSVNWRDAFIPEEDEGGKTRAQMERFKTQRDYHNTFEEAQQKIRSGQLKEELPADATDADVKAYRESNGIPLESKDYLEGLPEGMVLGEADVPVAEVFMEALHSVNAPPTTAHALIGKYNEFQEEMQTLQAETDSEQHKATEDELRGEWKGDYRANINLVGALLESSFGTEAKDQLLNGRFEDGRGFMNDPKILQGLAEIARKLNPIAAVVKPGGDVVQTMNDEITEIETYMSEHRTKYNKDEKMQLRLRELYEIRIKHNEAA